MESDGGADAAGPADRAEALAASERRFRLLAEYSSDLVFQISLDSTIEWVSPSSETLLGWRPDEMQGRPSDEFVHPEDIEVRRRAMRALERHVPATYEARIRRKDGSMVWLAVTVRAVLDDDGNEVGRVGSARNVEAEMEVRDALAQREQLYRTTVEAAPIGMALVDLDRRFVEVNPALCSIVGRSAEWLRSHAMADVLDPADDAADRAARTQLLSGEVEHVELEKRLVRPDGTRVWVEHAFAVATVAGHRVRRGARAAQAVEPVQPLDAGAVAAHAGVAQHHAADAPLGRMPGVVLPAV